MVSRADPPKRFRNKDELAVARFSAAGTWNYTSASPVGSATYTIDNTVTHDGYPVLRIDMTDECTQAWVGVTTGKTFTLPNDWNREFAAVYCVQSNYTSINNVTLYVGDTGNTSTLNKLIPLGGAANDAIVWHHNGWRTHRMRNVGTLDVPTANPAVTPATAISARLKFLKNNGPGTACSVYVAWLGVPAKSRPKVLFTYDHGTVGQYLRLFPSAVSKGIPITIGIQSDPIANGSSTHMNGAQLQEMYNHPSGLFEFYAYSRKVTGTAIGDQGLTNFLADYDTCADYLRSLGVRNPTLYHPYPFGDYTDDLMSALMDRGCKIARRADGSGARTNDTASCFTGKQMLSMDIIANSPGFGVTVAQAKASFDASIMANEHVVFLVHVINVAGDTTTSGWPIDYMEALFDHALLRQKQGLCDIVGMEAFYNGLANPRKLK